MKKTVLILFGLLALGMAQEKENKCEDELFTCETKLVEEHNRALRCCGLLGQETGPGLIYRNAFEEIVALKKKIRELEQELKKCRS